MPLLAATQRLALSVLALACAPTLAGQLAGTVRDAEGHPIAGALVVGSSDTAVKDDKGAARRWIATSDAAGRFAFDGFPAGLCHVTANAGDAGVGRERDTCIGPKDTAVVETLIVAHAEPGRVGGRVKRAAGVAESADDRVLVARSPGGEDGPWLFYGTRVEHDAWTLALPPGAWMAKLVTPAGSTGSTAFVLPTRTKPVDFDLSPAPGSHPEFARELQAMAARDQAVRNAWIAKGMDDQAAAAEVARVDRANLARLDRWIRQHGWPTAALVGADGMGDFWLLAQHGTPSFIARALPHLKAAADREEIAWSALVLTIDRDLTDRDKPQVYGTQAQAGPDGKMVAMPVRNAARLDERRAQVGLGPEADYLAHLTRLYAPTSRPQ